MDVGNTLLDLRSKLRKDLPKGFRIIPRTEATNFRINGAPDLSLFDEIKRITYLIAVVEGESPDIKNRFLNFAGILWRENESIQPVIILLSESRVDGHPAPVPENKLIKISVKESKHRGGWIGELAAVALRGRG